MIDWKTINEEGLLVAHNGKGFSKLAGSKICGILLCRYQW